MMIMVAKIDLLPPMMMVVNSSKERGSSVHHALDQARLGGQKCPCFGHLPEFGMIFVLLRFLVYQNTALFSTFPSSVCHRRDISTFIDNLMV